MQEYYKIMNQKEQRRYLRQNPMWYKHFNRVAGAHTHFKQDFDAAVKASTPSRLTTIDKHLNTANLMLKLIKGFK